ncbi:SusC/RagA family TonB-linked outer membrane protein [Pedobacter sp. MC2016-24]|uniref:SusC/RagA family TonB-linked outer membrane protein n=1 Tax=Pedobacter sp. MC2016-24 TaxID=2780090 RepID=UPI0018803259|nr:SusC/RagA family TonB-linked outer membrane protein [Pedobacter sp. MC2016-24]MBE9600476.1 SusC/RagA family TonB-linked outer membrane protein [Pedobacter sp. MC2016-24]
MNLYSYAKIPWITGRLMRKTILVMKLIFFIITIACVQVSAIGYAQNINIQQKDATLTNVFSTIEKQTGYSFFWKNEDLTKIKVDVKLQNASLEEALKEVFKGLPLTYAILKKSIVVQAKAPSFLDKVVAAFDGIKVVGNVGDMENKPLPGATVIIKGTKRSTTTDVKGQFSLANVPQDAILQISYMGYITSEVKISSDFLQIRLQLSTSKLDEIQVMAYGTTNRRLATSNIGTVTAKEIGEQPVMNPLLALAGRVPGVTVTPTSGYASGVVKVEIRGRSNIDPKFTSEPLYIIDGVPLTYLEVGGNSGYNQGSYGIIQDGGFAPGGGQSPMFNINPGDIESIDVLKDGDATAIYGSRGANGVVLITTKKGKAGATKITADVSQGISKNVRYWDMLNTQEYLKMRREAFKNDGIEPTALNAPDLLVWDTTRYTNWQKALWGNTGKLTRASTTLSGGNENTTFRLGTNFTRQTEILTASGANKIAGVILNVANTSLNRKFKTDLNFNYSYTDVNTLNTPSAADLAPNAPAIYDSNGELNFEEWNKAGRDVRFPFSSLKTSYRSQNKLLTGSLGLSYEIFKGLELSSTFGYNNGINNHEGYTPISSMNPLDNETGSAAVGTNTNENWMIEPKINYRTTISKGTFTAFMGGTLQHTATNGAGILGFGYTDDNLLKSIQLAPVKIYSGRNGDYKYAGLSARVGYSWDEKYIINLSGRRDGSSRFGPGKQYGNFGAVGLAWVASQEDWMKAFLPGFISFVKFRGSYALTGSDNVGEYQYLSQWSNLDPTYASIPNYGGITPFGSLHAVNPEYHWQTNKKLEFGANFSVLNDRINLEYNYYRNRCDNQLTDYPTPFFSGFGTVTANWPASLQNSGWEATLNARLMERKHFSWSLNFNISANHNLLLKYPDIEHSPYFNKYLVGQPINIQYLFHYTGVNPATGEYMFEDRNGNGTLDRDDQGAPGSDDRFVLLNSDPKFTGAFGTSVRYKDLSLSLFFQYKNQKGLNANFSSSAPGSMVNIPRVIYNDHWTQPGQSATYAGFTTLTNSTNQNIAISDLAYTDASYLRLNNVAFNYTLPKTFLNNKGINFFVQAQNLFVITGYKGIDPDIQNFGGLPTAKVITAGFSLTL